MSDLSLPFLILVASQSGIALVRVLAHLAVIHIALRNTNPEQRPQILRALGGSHAAQGTATTKYHHSQVRRRPYCVRSDSELR